MTELKPTHVRCFECDHDTPIEEGDEPSDTPCAKCVEEGEDEVYATQPVALIPCPNGITAADWRPGGYVSEDRRCDDDEHEPKSGLHVVEIEE